MAFLNRVMILAFIVGSCFLPTRSHAACGDGTIQNELLYGADGAGGNSSSLYVLDPATGAVLQTIGAIGFPITGLAVHPTTGELFGGTNGNPNTNPSRGFLIRIDEISGQGTQIGDMFPANTELAADLTFAPDGTLFGWVENNTDDLMTIDLSTGLGTVVGDSGISTGGSGLATLDGTVILLAGQGPASDLASIDPATGLSTGTVAMNGYTGVGDEVDALDFNSAGVLFGSVIQSGSAATQDPDLVTIDPTTGLVTTLGPTVRRLDAIAFSNPEACDDGNAADGDGCSADCKTIEPGFTCPQPGQACQPIVQCGNNQVEGSELCDDGNAVGGDGCSADCLTVEPGFTCPPSGGACTANPALNDLSGGGCGLATEVNAAFPGWAFLFSLLPLLVLKRKAR